MNEVEIVWNHFDFQKCILTCYMEAVTNKNTPIRQHLSRFYFSFFTAEDLVRIWTQTNSCARSLRLTNLCRHIKYVHKTFMRSRLLVVRNLFPYLHEIILVPVHETITKSRIVCILYGVPSVIVSQPGTAASR
ncbi:hypothetical protein DPMN_068206 [Dreissena polymorpha]|uniref:Uncharacterized protein n=1 Tax=Dreissena polymorpha TaxID=45954 RepID=A0A9D3Z1S8_DREPO|nr:hypothetical protein DPMN_068206 [Dreissena polymorpha]